jgi:hypothetical protein
MKKIIYLFTAIIFAACSSDSPEDNQNNNSNLKVKKITEGNTTINFIYSGGKVIKSESFRLGADKTIILFIYVDSKLRAKNTTSIDLNTEGIFYEEATEYSYTGDKITSSTVTNNQPFSNAFSNIYTYENNFLVNRKEYNLDGTINADYSYEY